MPSEAAVRDGVLRVRHPGARWLSTGFSGGFRHADAAYNISVPEGFSRTDLDVYVAERRRETGFVEPGPALLTGVSMEHVRGARSGDVVVYATAGLSNPAALPMDPPGGPFRTSAAAEPRHDGTVNLVVATGRALEAGALATLLSVVVEAKAATLLAETGLPGTTTDAVAVGCDPTGDPATFSGSGTPVGADARACVREAVRAALRSRHPDGDVPTSVDDAEYGVSTERRASVFRI